MGESKMIHTKHTFFLKSEEEADRCNFHHQALKANVIINKNLNYKYGVIKNFEVDILKYFGIKEILKNVILMKNGLVLIEGEEFVINDKNNIVLKHDWHREDCLSIMIS